MSPELIEMMLYIFHHHKVDKSFHRCSIHICNTIKLLIKWDHQVVFHFLLILKI